MTREISEQFGLNYLLKETPKEEGLTLRDFFAAFALAGLVANQGSPRTLGGDWLAAEAYHAADAMLARREK